MIQVLLVEDSPTDALLTRESLGDSSQFNVTQVCRLGEAVSLFAGQKKDVVLLDLGLPDSQGMETLQKFRHHVPGVPVIVLTASDNEELAIQAAQEGAQEYLVKDQLHAGNLRRAIRYVVERNRTEEALRLRDRAIQAVSQGILITDATRPDNPIVYASPGFEKLTGYRAAEVLGKNCRFLQGPDTNQQALADIRRAIKAGQECSTELLNYRKDGSPFWNALFLTPVRDEAGRLTHYVGVQVDVTGKKKLESQYRQAQKMEAVGRLAGGVAHDFNNLLTVINGYCQVLASILPPQDKASEMVGMIARAGERAADLTRQLLTYSRKQIQTIQVLNLNQVLASTEKILRRMIGEDVELVLMPGAGLHLVKADPGQIEQVVMNLAVNARDAMPTGGTLTIQTENLQLAERSAQGTFEIPAGSYVVLSVTDTGGGMDVLTQAHVFEPFFTTKEPGKGTGLGLAMVYGIVKQNNGYITVDSVLNRGTTFRIYLPNVREAERPHPGPRETANLPKGTETILLVEDEKEVRALTGYLLQQQGYKVLAASSGAEALEMSIRHDGPIDLLLTDVVMPNMSGRHVAEALRMRHPRMRVLYLSGYTNDTILRYGIMDAETAFLQKPFRVSDLAHKVREVLNRRS